MEIGRMGNSEEGRRMLEAHVLCLPPERVNGVSELINNNQMTKPALNRVYDDGQ
jgi:hypothetical protein